MFGFKIACTAMEMRRSSADKNDSLRNLDKAYVGLCALGFIVVSFVSKSVKSLQALHKFQRVCGLWAKPSS